MTMNFVSEVKPSSFKGMVIAESVENILIRSSDDKQGLLITFKVNGKDYVLGQERGGLRYFRSFDAAASTLQKYGFSRFEAETVDWRPWPSRSVKK